MKLVNERLIKKWEGLKLEAYLPTPNDVWTIGWGHTKGVRPGMKITRSKAQELFRKDIEWAENAVNRLVKVGLTQNQFDALVSLTFNIGETAFARSTLLRKLNTGDYQGAAEEFPRWVKQKGKTLRGLVRRRAEEMEVFLSDEVEEDIPSPEVEAEGPTPMKPLMTSKEVWGGITALLTGAGSFMAGLTPGAQETLSVALSVALVGFGVYFIANRLWARRKAER